MARESERELILKYCLQNAVFYNGKASPGAVLGKVLSENPELKKMVQEIKREADRIVREVNKLSLEDQKERLKELAPELLQKEIRVQEELPPLRDAVMGKVVTRFAPSPTGPLTFFHILRAGYLSYLYAEKYRGKFILRIEDTDPRNIEKRFYKWIEEDLLLSGIKPDKVVIESDNMPLYYKHCEGLIEEGPFYPCLCSAGAFRDLKNKKQACPCRDRGHKENLKLWKRGLRGEFREGEMVVRFKTSMQDPNPALRDPPMFRVIKHPHPLKERRYSMWPLYNYANVIEDHNLGITHVFRGKEHEHNTEIQKRLFQSLGWGPPIVVNFGMIKLPGNILHIREMKELVRTKRVSGWDDPRLPTIRALIRRGFQKEAFRRCAIQCGLTKHDIKFGIENLEGSNRKVLDPIANRYMVVTEPIRISVDKAPDIRVCEINLHPDFPERGKRTVPVNPRSIYISRKDLGLKEFRLKGLYNVKLKGRKAVYMGDELIQDMQKIQWVSIPNAKIKIITLEREIPALGEPSMSKLKKGDVIQMERVGFGRVDSKGREITVMFAHR